VTVGALVRATPQTQFEARDEWARAEGTMKIWLTVAEGARVRRRQSRHDLHGV